MTDIKQGSIVTWVQRNASGGSKSILGTVTGVYPLNNVATVRLEGRAAIFEIPLPLLRRAERIVVQQVAAQAWDDQSREDAIAGCRVTT